MTIHIDADAHPGSLRLWPGVLAVAVQWLLWLGASVVFPGQGAIGTIGGVVCGLVVVLWWLFFSRAPWAERLGAIAMMVVAVVVTTRIVDPSISNGMMGMMLPIYAIPALCLALVAALAVARRLSIGQRRAVMAVSILLACGAFTLLRTEGVTGDGDSDLHWRWTLSPEERLLAQAPDEPPPAPPPAAITDAPAPDAAAAEPPAPVVVPEPATPTSARIVEDTVTKAPGSTAAPAAPVVAAAWPGFRGRERNSNLDDVRIETDWSKSPPVEVWRRPIGPGWSSFAVRGDRIYTQEQRGEEEIVACYSLSTGAPLWRHRDPARFWESNGGAGPRGTPSLAGNRVYTFGATGILNALDAATGVAVWSRNAATDNRVPTPGWGFSSSPLVVGDQVIVAISGVLASYDLASGKPRWVSRAEGGGSYSSPHLATIAGVTQVLLMAGGGLRSVALTDGTLLWDHAWPGSPIVQPALLDDGVLISTSGMSGALGMRRLSVTRGLSGWDVTERWTSNRLKPYFNDFVVHEGHAYGFDGFILAAIGLDDGERKWKGGRYGNGQLLLLAEQDLLLVLSEEGELALVPATPDAFTELARFPALRGKTWNHPVLIGDLLLVRNGEEMAAFRLPLAGR